MKIPMMIVIAALIGAAGALQQGFIYLFDEHDPYLVAFIFWAVAAMIYMIIMEIGQWLKFMVAGGPWQEP